jgi:hypothetical protein
LSSWPAALIFGFSRIFQENGLFRESLVNSARFSQNIPENAGFRESYMNAV